MACHWFTIWIPDTHTNQYWDVSGNQVFGIQMVTVFRHSRCNLTNRPLLFCFQAKDIRYLPFSEQLDVLKPLGPNLPSEELSKILSFAHTLMTDEASNLGLPDFPIENLPSVVTALNFVFFSSFLPFLVFLWEWPPCHFLFCSETVSLTMSIFNLFML